MNNEQPKSIQEIAEELRGQLNELMMGLVNEPVAQIVAQIPALVTRKEWSDEEKLEAAKQLRVAVIAPFINGLVNAANASGTDLGTVLFYLGKGWEEIRAERMAHIAQQMLTKQGPSDG